jgi:hypothetical protein
MSVLPSCPTHGAFGRPWRHPDGDRCPICGWFFDGRAPAPVERAEVRTFAHYRSLVERTDRGDGHFPLEYHAGCLMEEAGEFFGLAKKVVYHRHPRDAATLVRMREELGDALWFLDRCAHRIGTTLEVVAAENDGKLKRRYPEQFSFEQSRNRYSASGDAPVSSSARGPVWDWLTAPGACVQVLLEGVEVRTISMQRCGADQRGLLVPLRPDEKTHQHHLIVVNPNRSYRTGPVTVLEPDGQFVVVSSAGLALRDTLAEVDT